MYLCVRLDGELTFCADCDRGRGQCSCRRQVHLRSCFPGREFYTQRIIQGTSSLGYGLRGIVGFVVDRR